MEVKNCSRNPLLSGKSSTKGLQSVHLESGKHTLTRSHCMTRRTLAEIARERS